MVATETTPLLNKIRALKTEGYTNLSAGLMNIRDCLEPTSTHRKCGVLLLTDGHANRGVSDASGLRALVQRLVQETPSLSLTTIGYGTDHQVDLLRDMATVGAGSYNIVHNLESVATTFGEVLGGLTTVVAQNVVVELPVGAEPMTGYDVHRETSGKVLVRIGDVYAENEIIVLFRLPGSREDQHVCVKGHDMASFHTINEDIVIRSPVEGEAVGKTVQLALFRYQVSEVLRESAREFSDSGAIRPKALALIDQLKALSYAQDQLVQMMIEDLEYLLQTLDSYSAAIPDEITSNMVQHSAYLAMGRGTRSMLPEDMDYHTVHPTSLPRSSSPGTGAGIGLVGATATTTPPQSQRRTRNTRVGHITSPFSNNVQNTMTQVLRTASNNV